MVNFMSTKELARATSHDEYHIQLQVLFVLGHFMKETTYS